MQGSKRHGIINLHCNTLDRHGHIDVADYDNNEKDVSQINGLLFGIPGRRANEWALSLKESNETVVE